MPVKTARSSTEGVRDDLHRRLRTRCPQIEDALLTRVLAISNLHEAFEPECSEELRFAVRTALDCALAALDQGGDFSSVPLELIAQARIAARNGIGLDTVLRCYIAGHSLLNDFIVEEAGEARIGPIALRPLLRSRATYLDRVLAVVGEEHAREVENRLSSVGWRGAEQVERLLAGELVDVSQLTYDFEAHHLAVIAKGPDADEAIRSMATPIDCSLLLVQRQDEMVWAWLGRRDPIDPLALQDGPGGPGVYSAFGEPARGLDGWRLTHRQAKAALPIALRMSKPSVRYAEVALLASTCRDDLLATSLRVLYLAPLEDEREGGEVARETLRAYFATERNLSSAAAVLGVSRRTVANRLRSVEGRLGRPLASCAAEMEAALRLHDLHPLGAGQNGTR